MAKYNPLHVQKIMIAHTLGDCESTEKRAPNGEERFYYV